MKRGISLNKIAGTSLKEQHRVRKRYEEDRLFFKSYPAKADIQETNEILSGFKIKTHIPHFDSLYQLLAWRKAIIKNSLNETN